MKAADSEMRIISLWNTAYSILRIHSRLKLEKGDVIDAEIVCDSGRLSVKIQKDDETPIYEKEKIDLSTTFQVPIEESGIYNITITGEKAKGSVCFKRVKG